MTIIRFRVLLWILASHVRCPSASWRDCRSIEIVCDKHGTIMEAHLMRLCCFAGGIVGMNMKNGFEESKVGFEPPSMQSVSYVFKICRAHKSIDTALSSESRIWGPKYDNNNTNSTLMQSAVSMISFDSGVHKTDRVFCRLLSMWQQDSLYRWLLLFYWALCDMPKIRSYSSLSPALEVCIINSHRSQPHNSMMLMLCGRAIPPMYALHIFGPLPLLKANMCCTRFDLRSIWHWLRRSHMSTLGQQVEVRIICMTHMPYTAFPQQVHMFR